MTDEEKFEEYLKCTFSEDEPARTAGEILSFSSLMSIDVSTATDIYFKAVKKEIETGLKDGTVRSMMKTIADSVKVGDR